MVIWWVKLLKFTFLLFYFNYFKFVYGYFCMTALLHKLLNFFFIYLILFVTTDADNFFASIKSCAQPPDVRYSTVRQSCTNNWKNQRIKDRSTTKPVHRSAALNGTMNKKQMRKHTSNICAREYTVKQRVANAYYMLLTVVV